MGGRCKGLGWGSVCWGWGKSRERRRKKGKRAEDNLVIFEIWIRPTGETAEKEFSVQDPHLVK